MGYAPLSSSSQLDMLMLRNSNTRTWHFYHKLPTDGRYMQNPSGTSSIPDT